jgi:hypothetical protein
MSLGLRHRFRLRHLAILALGLPFVVQGACGGNADDVGGTGGTGGAGEGGAGGGGDAGGMGGSEPDAEEEPEVPVSVCPKDPIVTLAGTGQMGSAAQPAIAWAGAGYLVVWEDARNGGSIYGAMVDAKGTRLAGSEADILIADTAGSDGAPEVLALPEGAGFLVAFENCAGASCSVDTIVLGLDGRPAAGAVPVTISPATNVQRRPYLAAGFGKIYVTFRERVMTPPAVVARVGILDAAGAMVGTGVLADMTDGEFPHVAVSADGITKVAVVFKKTTAGVEDIVLTQFDPELTNAVEVPVRTASVGNGTPLGTTSAANPVVQWNTNAWLVAWEDERNGEAQIFAATVDDATSAVSTARLAYEENGNWPTIATGGRNTSLIGFYGYPGQRVFLSRISADTGLRPGQVVLDSGKFPAVAYNKVSTADEYAVVYENDKARNIMFGTFTCASAQ